MTKFGISIVGRDEPGIIAAVSKVLLGLECNLADANMSVLNGNFAMVLMAQAPRELGIERLRYELALVTKRFELLVSVQSLEALPARQVHHSNEIAMVSVYGADRPGIVFAVTSTIAASGSNIVDMRTQKSESINSIYTLFIEVELASSVTVDHLATQLRSTVREFEVEIAVKGIFQAEL